ncbi:uncharacterized protein Z519_04923 [Cladophialophora bantiana CBS 173.52]|uniref:Uncharacterized protein n=1 Tax=Cladophialophora bantiana (strain ATCC 10958 / CBS 173.52 / CDC B-1940 / NIH 8579) TaxID=1442370 RepID=A0A0D2HNH1_CLAB1|nr:uncharacterized protein Z519_04923 [Cladophialophora bantiana CBS 173.52]KIW94943.1 hypothetical protein Z519_04923 [Cladophialophora bantiana CBS 173.52]
MSSSIPRIWRNSSLAGKLQRKQGDGSCASMPPGAPGGAPASNQSEIPNPDSMAALGRFLVNEQGSRFFEDPKALVPDEEASSSSRKTSITFVENPTPRPAGRDPPSRPPTPYIPRPPTPMGTSREVDPAGCCVVDLEQLDLARACRHWLRLFREIRQGYDREFEALYSMLERFSRFGYRYWRLLRTIEAVEKSLNDLAYLVQAVDWVAYDEVSELVDFFDAWVGVAGDAFSTMTQGRAPVNLDNHEERSGRKALMEEMRPELARLTEQLSAYAQKPLRRLRSELRAEA